MASMPHSATLVNPDVNPDEPPLSEAWQPDGREATWWAEHAPDRPWTLAEQADAEAARFLASGTTFGALCARALDDLAFKLRITDADTVEDHEARMEVMEDHIRAGYEAIGFEAGRDSCPCRRGRD